MKIIITEEQLRTLVENEDKKENLLNFTPFIESPVNQWDSMFLHMNRKKGGKYDGYYINGNINLVSNKVTELNYLVKVGGDLYLTYSEIKFLDNLVRVDGDFSLVETKIKSLDKLKYVGGLLDLYEAQIESLDKLKYVGGYLNLTKTPLSKTTTKEELRKINVGGKIYL